MAGKQKSGAKGAGRAKDGVVPLNAWAEKPDAVEVWRTDVVRLFVDQRQEEKLLEVAGAVEQLVELENERRRRVYEETGRIDTSVIQAYRNPEYAEIKRVLGSVNFDETLRYVSEAWRSFGALLHAGERGELPAWLEPRPPRRLGRLLVFVRFDNYRVDAQSGTIELGYYNLRLKFRGGLRWWRQRVQQGRLVMAFDDVKRAWYGHIASRVVLKRSTASGLKCGIDMGQIHLVAAVLESGAALLYRGSVLKSDYHYLRKRVSELDKVGLLDEFDRAVWLEKRRALHHHLKQRRVKLIQGVAAHLATLLSRLGVAEVYIGYPRYIAQEKPCERNSAWPYWRVAREVARACENAGVAVFLVPEERTSSFCAYHGCGVVRGPRGLVRCPLGHTLHSDLNAALNILKQAGGRLPERVRVLSFTPTPSGVTERRRKAYSPAQKAG
uniref:Transposase n=1 Tax=Thermofilum pendens TaxID=2269 RepID=A0A7C3WWA4_THEPE